MMREKGSFNIPMAGNNRNQSTFCYPSLASAVVGEGDIRSSGGEMHYAGSNLHLVQGLGFHGIHVFDVLSLGAWSQGVDGL